MTNLANHIDAFFGDTKVQRLLNLSRETRALRVCFPREVPLSRFLAWIFDPTQGHGLQDTPIRRLLTAAGQNLSELSLSVKTRRYLGAASLSTSSFMGALIQTEVALNSGASKLDVLILDPTQNLLIAIENKAGATARKGQLDKYSAALKEQYPDWMRIQIFMDMYGAWPNDSAQEWIPLDYQWLADEMREAENSPWIGEESRTALQDFRCAIDFEDSAFIHVDEQGDDVLDIMQRHTEVFNLMTVWSQGPDTPTAMLPNISKSKQKAEHLLYLAYWQRRDLWLQCLPMRQYAGWLKQARQAFPEILHDTYKTNFHFSLPQWMGFADTDQQKWPLCVSIRILPPRENDKIMYLVTSILRQPLNFEMAEAILDVSCRLREEHLSLNRSITDGQRSAKLRLDSTGNLEGVGCLLVKHLKMLNKAFEHLY